MSDPTARRGDNIKRLLEEMKSSKKGWGETEIKDRLFELYRFGVTEQTLDKIFLQLKNHSIIRGIKKECKRKHLPPTVLWYPSPPT